MTVLNNQPYQTTLCDERGRVHSVTMPHIPLGTPSDHPIHPVALCGIGPDEVLPVRLAVQTRHPSFRGRAVTCVYCLYLAREENR